MLISSFFGVIIPAKRIPEIAGSFGNGIREFKRQMNDIGNTHAAPQLLPPRDAADADARVTGTTEESRAPKRLIE
jgi:Sec-independent protein translocase protein TatA